MAHQPPVPALALAWSASRPCLRDRTLIPSLDFSFATHADVPQVVELVTSGYRGDPSRAGWTTEADLLAGQRTDAAMVGEALDRPGTLILLAHEHGQLVGCCEIQRPGTGEQHGCGTDADSPPGTAYFGMFSVDPTLQRGGIGRRLLAEAERIAREEWSATRMELTVIDLRSELIAWYERRGYTATGEHRAFPYGDPRFGLPKRDDLRLAVLSKVLA